MDIIENLEHEDAVEVGEVLRNLLTQLANRGVHADSARSTQGQEQHYIMVDLTKALVAESYEWISRLIPFMINT